MENSEARIKSEGGGREPSFRFQKRIEVVKHRIRRVSREPR
jgi:hypothetical protein